MEKKADVTNVGMGRGFTDWHELFYESENGTRGYILKESYDIPDDPGEEMNVVAWTEKPDTTGEWTVYFKVIVDGDTDWGAVGVAKPEDGDATYPAVTAHILEDEAEGGGFLVVDLAYQFVAKEGTDRSIQHIRYTQDTKGSYNAGDFDDNSSLNVVVGEANEDYLHPDIVYAAYWESSGPVPLVLYDIDHLYITYEKLLSGERTIRVRSRDGALGTGWGSLAVLSDSEVGNAWYPRIDAGIDMFDGNVNYNVAVVYHTYEAEDGVSVFYTYEILNTSSPSWIDPLEIDGIGWGDDNKPNGVPYIDIDPLENKLLYGRENYAHIVWSKFKLANGSDIEPYYINSSMIEDTVSVYQIFDSGGSTKEGLPVITTFARQFTGNGDLHGTVEFISNDDDDFDVWTVMFWLNNDNENQPRFTLTKSLVSSGGHHSSAAGPPWIHGPSSAAFGLYDVLCAWTEWSDDGSKPDILYDYLSN